MELSLNIPIHSVLLTAGPYKCGKSTFVKLLTNNLSEFNTSILSSDEIRQSLINQNLDKNDNRMGEVSGSAFRILKVLLREHMTYPVSKHFIFIDTSGLSMDFRNEIKEICNEYNYSFFGLIFCYKDNGDYYINNNFKDIDKNTIKNSITRLKENEITRLGMFDKKIIIQHHPSKYNNVKLTVENYTLWKKCVSSYKNSFIIGDIHGCIDELKCLLLKGGFIVVDKNILQSEKTNDTQIVFIGDLIDKGSPEKILETIEFIHHNLQKDFIKLIVGNHEKTVYKLLCGHKKVSDYADGFVDTYFNTYNIINNNDIMKNKFFDIYNNMIPFLKHSAPRGSFIATHAPCNDKYKGKLDETSLKAQSYFYYDKNKSLSENIKPFQNTDSHNYPFHVFGHIATQSCYNGKMDFANKNNLLMIDTGCIHGNKLSGVLLGESYENPIYKSIHFMNNQKIVNEILGNLNKVEIDKASVMGKYDKLDHSEKYKIDSLLHNQVHFISGTICPAPANKTKNLLESLEDGLLYYKDNGFKQVCMQAKYMGSRCQVYLTENIDDTKFISRNGNLIKLSDEDRISIHGELINRLMPFIKKHKIKLIILDCELMPWYAIGNTLIEKHFKTADYAIGSELKILSESGFSTKLQEIKKHMDNINFKNDLKLKKEELYNKYGQNLANTYTNIYKNYDHHNSIETNIEYYKIYKKQIELYASEGKIHIKPFSIIKIITDENEYIEGIVNENSIDETLNHYTMFKLLSDDDIHMVNFDDDMWLENAEKFYSTIVTDKLMEGVVIKPLYFDPNYAISIKVRNQNYLTLIYGYNYLAPEKYQKLIESKNIKKKLRTSIDEFKIGLSMMKHYDRTINNVMYLNDLMEFATCEKIEKEIDPRL